MTDLDTLLRDSLQAEAEDVLAGPELFDRIRDAADRRPPLARRVAPWLLVAAAAAAVGGVLATIQDGEQTVTTPLDTPPATQPNTPTTLETETSTTFEAAAIPTDRPDEVVAVLTDGRLVVLDVDRGSVIRQLASVGTATEADAQLYPQDRARAIIDAAVSPDRQTVYFGTSGRDGGVYRMPVDGSAEPQRLGDGWGVSASSDGRWLAYALYDEWGLLDLRTGDDHRFDSTATNPQVNIAPDGTMVEVTSFDFENADGAQVQEVFGIDGTGDLAGGRDGSAEWQNTMFSDGSGDWSLEIIENDDGTTVISWGSFGGGLTTSLPNPEGLVVRMADW